MADALLSARCLRRDLSMRVEEGSVWVLWHGVWWYVFCMLWGWLSLLFSPAALSLSTSVHLQLQRNHVHLHTLTARHGQTQLHIARQRASGIKWSWVLTMAVILWRGWGAVSLYSANLITWLLFACVSTQCNLKATPGPLGDAKTACQSTGTPPKWIKVGYSGLSWPWGNVHTSFCSRRNKLNTVFYYRVTVKCLMYVNPSGIGSRRARFWRDRMMVLREKEKERRGYREQRRKGNWFKQDIEGDQSREKKTLRKW